MLVVLCILNSFEKPQAYEITPSKQFFLWKILSLLVDMTFKKVAQTKIGYIRKLKELKNSFCNFE